MPLAGFEHTTPVFERAKTVQFLDRVATMVGEIYDIPQINYCSFFNLAAEILNQQATQ
jgi:hypothetical protein